MRAMCRKSMKIQFPPSRDLQGTAASPLFLKCGVLHQQYSLISGDRPCNRRKSQNPALRTHKQISA